MHIKSIRKLCNNFALATPQYTHTHTHTSKHLCKTDTDTNTDTVTDTNAHSPKLLKSPNKFVFVVWLNVWCWHSSLWHKFMRFVCPNNNNKNNNTNTQPGYRSGHGLLQVWVNRWQGVCCFRRFGGMRKKGKRLRWLLTI